MEASRHTAIISAISFFIVYLSLLFMGIPPFHRQTACICPWKSSGAARRNRSRPGAFNDYSTTTASVQSTSPMAVPACWYCSSTAKVSMFSTVDFSPVTSKTKLIVKPSSPMLQVP